MADVFHSTSYHYYLDLFSWLCTIVDKPFDGKGTFEDNLAGLALPLIILIPSMFVPDVIVDFVLPGEIVHAPIFWNILNPVRLIFASLWVMAVQILAVKETQALSLLKAFTVTVLSYIPCMFLNLTCIH